MYSINPTTTLLAGLSVYSVALAAPAGSTATASAPHSAVTQAPENANTTTDFADNVAALSQVCIRMSSPNAGGFYYAGAGSPWGTATGSIASLNGQYCVPTGSTGGAAYFAAHPNPGPGDTKLECEFPASGQAYCDVSLVDGYSVAVQCSSSSSGNFGGNTDLWNTGEPCVDYQAPPAGESGGICINQQGYAASQSDVTAFFQKGVQNGEEYCIWQDCPIPNFPVTETLSCTIGAS